MSVLYIDCQYGISGDMTLAALLDLGADLTYIREQLSQLPLGPFTMESITKVEKGIACQKLLLDFPDQAASAHSHAHGADKQHHTHRHAADIYQLIRESALPPRVKEQSLALFEEIARAEGKIHQLPPEKVHFHEVGAMDSLIDIIGVALALENLAVEELIFAAVPTGQGMIQIAHGLYPVPAPATAEILVGVPLSDFTCQGELTTPTGAAFAKVLATAYGAMPAGKIEKIGYGVGTKEFAHPNILRAVLIQKK